MFLNYLSPPTEAQASYRQAVLSVWVAAIFLLNEYIDKINEGKDKQKQPTSKITPLLRKYKCL